MNLAYIFITRVCYHKFWLFFSSDKDGYLMNLFMTKVCYHKVELFLHLMKMAVSSHYDPCIPSPREDIP